MIKRFLFDILIEYLKGNFQISGLQKSLRNYENFNSINLSWHGKCSKGYEIGEY